MIKDLIKDVTTDSGVTVSAWLDIGDEDFVYFQIGYVTLQLPILDFKEVMDKLNSAYSTLEEIERE